MTTLVVCLGNELVGDDGVGIRIGRVLGRLELPSAVEVMIRPNLGFELIELLGEYERLILVDAMTTGRPAGTCAVIELADAAGMASCPTCAHSIGIPEVLQLAGLLNPERTRGAIQIVGVEGLSMDEFGLGLTEPVQAGMIEAVDRVLVAVGAGQALRDEGRREADAEARRNPTMGEVLGTREA